MVKTHRIKLHSFAWNVKTRYEWIAKTNWRQLPAFPSIQCVHEILIEPLSLNANMLDSVLFGLLMFSLD